MARPLRIEFPGAIYHITSRGDRREPIYRDDGDRQAHLALMGQALERFDAQALAYCLMGNHYHLVLHTRRANLSRTMRHINGVYTQQFNRRHGLVGHLFQGRFKAILVDRDSYLLALCRYVERNPVASGLVRHAQDWAWSSCRAHLGVEPTPVWLDTTGLHGHLLGRPVAGQSDSKAAVRIYRNLVNAADANDVSFWQHGLRQQLFLGDDGFVQHMLGKASATQLANAEHPVAQRTSQPKRDWQAYLQAHKHAADALASAYRDGAVTMKEMAKTMGVSVPTISRRIAASERKSER
jgi:putative transposase